MKIQCSVGSLVKIVLWTLGTGLVIGVLLGLAFATGV